MSDQNQPDMTTNQQTAIRIREERLKQNITQQAIADHLGIDISSYSRLENGTVEITITRLEAIAEFFKVPAIKLIPSANSNIYHINNCLGVNNGNGTFNQILDQNQFAKSIDSIFKELEFLKNNLK